MENITERVRRFIIDDLGWEGTPGELTADLPLIAAGVLDSIGILTMVQFLESHYGILIEDSEIISSHLASLASIDRYVQSKIGIKSGVVTVQSPMTPNVSKLSRPTGRAGLPR